MRYYGFKENAAEKPHKRKHCPGLDNAILWIKRNTARINRTQRRCAKVKCGGALYAPTHQISTMIMISLRLSTAVESLKTCSLRSVSKEMLSGVCDFCAFNETHPHTRYKRCLVVGVLYAVGVLNAVVQEDWRRRNPGLWRIPENAANGHEVRFSPQNALANGHEVVFSCFSSWNLG